MTDPKQPYKPDIITINTMLRHYGATKDLKEMIRLMDMLPTFGLKPDVYTYTTIVEGLLKSGRRETARETLDMMEQSGIAPSTATYSLLISDLAKSGEPDNMIRAESLVKKMRMAKLVPTVITYTALLDGYFRANKPQAGVGVLKQMERDGILLNKVTYNMILRSIVNSNVDSRLVDKAIKHMGGSSSPFQGAYSSIINAMLKSNAVPDDDTWFIILSGLHRAERFDEAEEVMKEMDRQRFKPISGSALSRVMGDLLERRPARFRRLR
jgi:pentatricopeptide repeat protein